MRRGRSAWNTQTGDTSWSCLLAPATWIKMAHERPIRAEGCGFRIVAYMFSVSVFGSVSFCCFDLCRVWFPSMKAHEDASSFRGKKWRESMRCGEEVVLIQSAIYQKSQARCRPGKTWVLIYWSCEATNSSCDTEGGNSLNYDEKKKWRRSAGQRGDFLRKPPYWCYPWKKNTLTYTYIRSSVIFAYVCTWIHHLCLYLSLQYILLFLTCYLLWLLPCDAYIYGWRIPTNSLADRCRWYFVWTDTGCTW